jgi:hypothetical protein
LIAHAFNEHDDVRGNRIERVEKACHCCNSVPRPCVPWASHDRCSSREATLRSESLRPLPIGDCDRGFA